jgi:hypothetical protein
MGYGDSDLSRRNKALVCAGVICVIVAFILLTFSWSTLNYDEYGLIKSSISGALNNESAYDTGMHWVGLGYSFERFPKMFRSVEFISSDRKFSLLSSWILIIVVFQQLGIQLGQWLQ